MPRTLYLHAHGRTIAQVKDGVRTDYLTDALGSITATKNQSQQIVNTYRWKPYGGLLAKTGTGDDPKYGWTGDTGSRITKTNWVNQYNVFRHYGSQQVARTTVDLYWPELPPFSYSSNPTTYYDPIGLAPCIGAETCKCKPESIVKKWKFRFSSSDDPNVVRNIGKFYIAWQHERSWNLNAHCDYKRHVITASRVAIIDPNQILRQLCDSLVDNACETVCKVLVGRVAPPPVAKWICKGLCEALMLNSNICDALTCRIGNTDKYELYSCCSEYTERECPGKPQTRRRGVYRCGNQVEQHCIHLAPAKGNYTTGGRIDISC